MSLIDHNKQEIKMKVLGVSCSPIKNSNTDRALREVLDATGCETEFIKLADYTAEPCSRHLVANAAGAVQPKLLCGR